MTTNHVLIYNTIVLHNYVKVKRVSENCLKWFGTFQDTTEKLEKF